MSGARWPSCRFISVTKLGEAGYYSVRPELMRIADQSVPRRQHGPPSRDDVLEVGFDVLAEHGRKTLTLDVVCRRTGIARHRFYCYFDDMQEYRAALVTMWGKRRVTTKPTSARFTPRDRLEKMMTFLVEPRNWAIDRELREWAKCDAGCAANMRVVDLDVVARMREAFLEDGFSSFEADVRANALFASGFGLAYLSGSTPSEQAVSRLGPYVDALMTATR